MARPLPEPVRRTRRKEVMFSPEEWAEVEARARRCGVNPNRFIRAAALGSTLRVPHDPASDAAVRQLARIGNHLDQLARDAHAAGRSADAERLGAALDALLRTIDRL